MISWTNNSYPTGVVKPVYERSTFPLTAKVMTSVVRGMVHILFIIQTDFHKDGNMLQPVRMMFGVSSIVPNTNIDGNDLHDCVK